MPDNPLSPLEERKFELEREKLTIEKEKLNIELQRLNVERARTFTTAASIAIPLAVVAISVWFSYLTERARAKTEFEVKAAEIIMAHQDPYEMKGRARILRTIFPDRLTADFGEKFDEQRFTVPLPSDEKFLLQLLVQHPEQKAEIIRMWRVAYPQETWVEQLNK